MKFCFLQSIIFVLFFSGCGQYNQKVAVIQGHAHNDYEQKRPLQDALDNGFVSVEVDVHLVNGDLYVSHDLPRELHPGLRLEQLYLKPLEAHILKNNGSVYPNHEGFFYLMIDFKSSAIPSYNSLKKILPNYQSIISVVQNGEEQNAPVKIFISGNRPIDEVLNDEPKLAALDGRPGDLDKQLPTAMMPVISDNFSNHLSWNGSGPIRQADKNKLKKLVQNTHTQNKKLRLWASPDNENVWKFLLDNGVDLINTDRLQAFSVFFEQYNSPEQ